MPIAVRRFSSTIFFHLLLIISIGKASSSSQSKSPLDCDFSSDCCWATTRVTEQWEIENGNDIDLNAFRKTFLTGKTRPPPTGNYAIRVENQRKSSLISCAVCSLNGKAIVKFRHWQTANAKLKICWQLEGDGSPLAENCRMARHSKQSKLNTYRFENIEKGKNFRLVLIVENADADVSSNEATIIVDRIKVDYESCDHNPNHLIYSTTSTPSSSLSRKKQKARSSKTLEQFQRINNSKKRADAYLKNVDKQIAKVVDAKIVASTLTTKAPPKSTGIRATTVPKLLPADPLTDLIGKEFVEFLDPNYESDDDENDVEDDDVDDKISSTTTIIKATTTAVTSTPSSTPPPPPPPPPSTSPTSRQIPQEGIVDKLPIRPIVVRSISDMLPRGKPLPVQAQNGIFSLPAHSHQPLPLGVPSTCSTPGGCLFESDFCGWTTPFGINNKFHLKKLHMSSFAESIVPTGELAVMEAETKMDQAHTIVFDALEFSLGTRLIACCLSNGKLTCPFSTPAEQTAPIWQFSKFECPIDTSKIAFICENFGLSDGICGIDNIRIHSSTDVFFLEPCQKEKLHRN